MVFMKVKDCKISDYVTASKDDNIYDVTKKLGYNKSIIVLDKKKPVGIITSRDLVRRVLMARKDPKTTLAKDIMTKPVVTAKLDDDLKRTSEIMLNKDFLTMPVVDKKGLFSGVITVYDVISALKRKNV